MSFESTFSIIERSEIHGIARQRKAEGWRYVQTLAVNTPDGIDVLYTFMLDGVVENLTIPAVGKDDAIKSITDVFLEAFVWENEIHDLFGVTFDGVAIDFAGAFYSLAEKEPMTVISPEKLAAREKAEKIAAAKAAKAAKTAKDAVVASGEHAASEQGATSNAEDDELEQKLAAMDPAKAAKVRAALLAKAKKAKSLASASDDVREGE